MAAHLNEESRRLLRLLDDGQWHQLDDIRAKLADSIAPGRALRKYDERSANWRLHNGERVGRELSDLDKIASGQRTMARIAIKSLSRKWLEVQDNLIRLRPGLDLTDLLPPRFDQADTARTPPGAEPTTEPTTEPTGQPAPTAAPASESMEACASCGLLVANVGQHEEFHRLHSELAADPADQDPPEEVAAFFTEAQIRAIVRDEFEQSLDAFQRGMQTWFIHRFAALESMVQGLPRDDGFSRQNRRAGQRRGLW